MSTSAGQSFKKLAQKTFFLLHNISNLLFLYNAAYFRHFLEKLIKHQIVDLFRLVLRSILV